MADLNSQIPLEGVSTTHPVLPQTPLQIQGEAADVGLKQAQTQVAQTTAQQIALDNQLKQINLQGIQAYTKASAAMQGNPYGSQGQPGAPAAPAGGAAPTGGGPGIPAGTPGSMTMTPASSTTGGGATPSEIPVLPPGVKADYTINKSANWYNDADGNPVSFFNGPRIRPDGSPNKMSSGYISDLTNLMAQNGSPPALVQQTIKDMTENAQNVDTKSQDIFQKHADAVKATVAAQQAVITEGNSIAYRISQSPNPVMTYHTMMDQNAPLMKSMGLTGDPKVDIPKIEAMAAASPEGQELVKTQSTLRLQKAQTFQASTGAQKNIADTGKIVQDTQKVAQDLKISGSQDVMAAQQDLTSKAVNLQKTDRALSLLNNYVGGHPTATLGEMQNYFGSNPEFAEARALLSQDNLTAIKGAVGQGNRLNQTEYRTLNATQINPDMPGRAIQNLLYWNRELQTSDLDSSRTNIGNIARAVAPAGTDVSGALKRLNETKTPELAPGESKVGSSITGPDGKTHVKVKPGLDFNQDTWKER